MHVNIAKPPNNLTLLKAAEQKIRINPECTQCGHKAALYPNDLTKRRKKGDNWFTIRDVVLRLVCKECGDAAPEVTYTFESTELIDTSYEKWGLPEPELTERELWLLDEESRNEDYYLGHGDDMDGDDWEFYFSTAEPAIE